MTLPSPLRHSTLKLAPNEKPHDLLPGCHGHRHALDHRDVRRRAQQQPFDETVKGSCVGAVRLPEVSQDPAQMKADCLAVAVEDEELLVCLGDDEVLDLQQILGVDGKVQRGEACVVVGLCAKLVHGGDSPCWHDLLGAC